MPAALLLSDAADEILRDFEKRRASTTVAEARRRRAGLQLGWEFNRIQGGVRCPVGARLGELYATGRVSEGEYLKLASKLAERGLLGSSAGEKDGI